MWSKSNPVVKSVTTVNKDFYLSNESGVPVDELLAVLNEVKQTCPSRATISLISGMNGEVWGLRVRWVD